MSHYVDIRRIVEVARHAADGGEVHDEDFRDMALTILQLHAGYERLRAELVRTAPRWNPGPGEWQSFHSDDVPRYPTFIHTRCSFVPDPGAK